MGAQSAQRVADVLPEPVDAIVSLHAILPELGRPSEAPFRHLDRLTLAGEASAGFGHGRVSRHPEANEIIGARREVELDLLVHLLSRASSVEEREAKEPAS